jgi:hypothetical protein
VILPPPLHHPATLPPRKALRNRDAERLHLQLLRQSYPPEPTWTPAWAFLIFTATILLFLAFVVGCSFELPENPLRDPVPSWIPEPGARPEAFSCTVPTEAGDLTVSAHSADVTRFQLEGEPAVLVQSADAVTDIEMAGVEVVVIGDLLVVGREWWRVTECDA